MKPLRFPFSALCDSQGNATIPIIPRMAFWVTVDVTAKVSAIGGGVGGQPLWELRMSGIPWIPSGPVDRLMMGPLQVSPAEEVTLVVAGAIPGAQVAGLVWGFEHASMEEIPALLPLSVSMSGIVPIQGSPGGTPLGTSSGGATGAYANAVLADGPVGYWPLSDSGGQFFARDQSGNGLLGTMDTPGTAAFGGPNVLASNPQDTSANFTGSDGTLIRMPGVNPYITDNASGQTLELWFNWAGRPSYGSSFGQHFYALAFYAADATNSDWQENQPGQWWSVYFENAVGSIAGSPPVSPGKHHFVYVRDKVASLSRVYLDGAQVGAKAMTTFTQPASGQLRVGGNGLIWSGGNPTYPVFDGQIGHVAIYNKALTSARIASHFNIGRVPPG